MTAFNLAHLGIVDPVEIEGVVTELRSAASPVVFLIDEHHTTPECIAQNIASLSQLVANANVRLIGVESHELGAATAGTVCNQHPEVAHHFLGKAEVTVVGVESTVLCDQIQADMAKGWWTAGVGTHPNNYLRSCHFLSGLFKLRRERGVAGNLALNAGRTHIDHIAEMIRCGRADELAGMAATYVRIRSTAYPAAPNV